MVNSCLALTNLDVYMKGDHSANPTTSGALGCSGLQWVWSSLYPTMWQNWEAHSLWGGIREVCSVIPCWQAVSGRREYYSTYTRGQSWEAHFTPHYTPHYMAQFLLGALRGPFCQLVLQGALVSSKLRSQCTPGDVATMRGSHPRRRLIEEPVWLIPASHPLQGTKLTTRNTPEASLRRLVPLLVHLAVWELLLNVSKWVLQTVDGSRPPQFNGLLPSVVEPEQALVMEQEENYCWESSWEFLAALQFVASVEGSRKIS